MLAQLSPLDVNNLVYRYTPLCMHQYVLYEQPVWAKVPSSWCIPLYICLAWNHHWEWWDFRTFVDLHGNAKCYNTWCTSVAQSQYCNMHTGTHSVCMWWSVCLEIFLLHTAVRLFVTWTIFISVFFYVCNKVRMMRCLDFCLNCESFSWAFNVLVQSTLYVMVLLLLLHVRQPASEQFLEELIVIGSSVKNFHIYLQKKKRKPELILKKICTQCWK